MSNWTEDDLNDIFDGTSGKCRLCGKELAWKNYGVVGARAAWHVGRALQPLYATRRFRGRRSTTVYPGGLGAVARDTL